jgi:hypothetical protein
VALAGGTERAVQLDPEVVGGGEQFLVAQTLGKAQRRAHRSDGVRAGRSDADLEQVEDAE